MQQDIIAYNAPWPLYALGWSNQPDHAWHFAAGSFIEEYRNKLSILKIIDDSDCRKIVQVAETDHHYPITKLQFIPSDKDSRPPIDLLATSGDFLRIWQFSESDGIIHRHIFNNNKSSEFCAPITSHDWNETSVNILATSSIDTTCSIWDISTQQVKTQLIAHDKEVYDLGFTQGVDVFASVGADGSVRMFDLRNLEHSTIIYETPDSSPLLRLSWNKQDPNYLATFQMDSRKIIILDIRIPSIPVVELDGHAAAVNACTWAPQSSSLLCSVGDDARALLWDTTHARKQTLEPALCYETSGEVSQVAWSKQQSDWLSVIVGERVEVLRI